MQIDPKIDEASCGKPIPSLQTFGKNYLAYKKIILSWVSNGVFIQF